MRKDVRWAQRFENFGKALADLTADMQIVSERKLSRLEEKGLIQAFKFTFELAWNCIKDFFENEGEKEIYGSKSAIRVAFKRGLIEHGQIWMDMIESRNQTVHTYHQETADKIAVDVVKKYYPEFVALHNKLTQIKNE